jgi:hypothetical protein
MAVRVEWQHSVIECDSFDIVLHRSEAFVRTVTDKEKEPVEAYGTVTATQKRLIQKGIKHVKSVSVEGGISNPLTPDTEDEWEEIVNTFMFPCQVFSGKVKVILEPWQIDMIPFGAGVEYKIMAKADNQWYILISGKAEVYD